MDTVAKRLADAAHLMVGRFTDIPYADWENATDHQKEFWRELARVTQDKEHDVPTIEPEAKPKKGKSK